MADQKIEATHLTELNRRTNRLVGRSPMDVDLGENEQIGRLTHEIKVNHAALKMKNEELSDSRYRIEQANQHAEQLYRKYASLFNSAPIGYLVVDRDGVIHELNLAAAIILNAPRSTLTGRCITDFIHHEDQDGFYYQKLACQKRPDTVTFELKMKQADGFFFDAQLQMQSLTLQSGEEPQYTIALVDISEHAQLSSCFALEQKCLALACTANDLQALLEAYVQEVKAYLQCDAVGIRTRDAAGNIPYQAYDGFSKAFYASESPLSLHTDQCMCIAVIKGNIDPGRPFFTAKGSFYINGTSRFLATVPPADLGTTRNACNAHGYESVALIPVPIGNTINGLIHVADRRENRFPLRLVEALETVGARLGLSLQRFHLQQQLSESVDMLNDLSSHLLTVQEDEQRRIAMELHDGCGQDLNVLKLRLKSLQQRLPADAADLSREVDALMTYSDKIIDDLRDIAHGLKPAALDALGLTAATRQMIREFSTLANVQVEADIDWLDRIKEPTTQTCLFRIFQEALTNVHKHAQATWVLMAARREGNTIRIRIEDNGIGFDAQKKPIRADDPKAMGLSAMALRCRMIGADLSLDSEAGKGSRLIIGLPCPNPKAVR